MSVFDKSSPVALDALNGYEYDNLLAVIKNQLAIIVPDGFFKGKKVAFIHKKDCIRCFCCQELCPHRRVKIKTNPIVKIVNGTK